MTFAISSMLDHFRDLAEAAMTDSARVIRPVYSDDSASGGGIRLDQLVYAGSCRFVPDMRGALEAVAQRPDSVLGGTIHFPFGTDIRTGDAIELNRVDRYEAIIPVGPKTNDYDTEVTARYHSPVVP